MSWIDQRLASPGPEAAKRIHPNLMVANASRRENALPESGNSGGAVPHAKLKLNRTEARTVTSQIGCPHSPLFFSISTGFPRLRLKWEAFVLDSDPALRKMVRIAVQPPLRLAMANIRPATAWTPSLRPTRMAHDTNYRGRTLGLRDYVFAIVFKRDKPREILSQERSLSDRCFPRDPQATVALGFFWRPRSLDDT